MRHAARDRGVLTSAASAVPADLLSRRAYRLLTDPDPELAVIIIHYCIIFPSPRTRPARVTLVRRGDKEVRAGSARGPQITFI